MAHCIVLAYFAADHTAGAYSLWLAADSRPADYTAAAVGVEPIAVAHQGTMVVNSILTG